MTIKIKHNYKDIDLLLKIAHLSIPEVYSDLNSNDAGLSAEEIEDRIQRYGKNSIARQKTVEWYWLLISNFKNPFILVLLVIGIVSYLSNDIKGSVVVAIMILLSVIVRFVQEYRSSQSAEALRKMVRTNATVQRKDNGKAEIPLEYLVPGDIVFLSAGDMVPADLRLIFSKDLFISQAALTGESLPIEKVDTVTEGSTMRSPTEMQNLCFMGSSVISGFAKAIVINTGSRTYFGTLAKSIVWHRAQTNFDKGINKVTWVLIKFILVMVPLIFLINGFFKEDWQSAFLFAIAVAVGLTPEMLPVIVTANLAKGAVAMSKFKVIVKRLNSIQSLGAMNILCTDKTGTLTQDKIILQKYLDIHGNENDKVLQYGYLNSHYQNGLKNMLDIAVLEHTQLNGRMHIQRDYEKVDEIPFDFSRKRMSVIVRYTMQKHLLICKGSVDELLKVCSRYELGEERIHNMSAEIVARTIQLANELSDEGFRVIAVAYNVFPMTDLQYSVKDEHDLVFLGLMAFLDPPKETAREAIEILGSHNIKVKVLTGDNEIVTKRICQEVNLPFENVLLGSEIEQMSDLELSLQVENVTVFAKLTPLQKARIIKTLQSNGHIVGFLGDGINDAPGLIDADVGISVDTATDIARESADIILLEKSLLVLGEGVIKGREVYGNIIKYIKMTASSNFGNVFSVLIASILLPFLPLLPLQLMVQNLLYDFSQLSIPWDKMDPAFLRRARQWDATGIARFMLCIGPVSTLFDLMTFALMWYVFQANTVELQDVFQSGWFVEGLLSQTLIVHLIRTKKIPFMQSTASLPVIVTTIFIMGLGVYLPYSQLGESIGLTDLPHHYFYWLIAILLAYCFTMQFAKVIYIKKFHAWL